MNSTPSIPVTVVAGFLGAGKTTLLNRILSEQHGKKYAVIVNEFGELGVDNDLVVNADEEVFEMNNGCICCTVRGDLIRIVGGLMKRRDKFDGIIIETTGLANPAPVAQTFFVDETVRARTRLREGALVGIEVARIGSARFMVSSNERRRVRALACGARARRPGGGADAQLPELPGGAAGHPDRAPAGSRRRSRHRRRPDADPEKLVLGQAPVHSRPICAAEMGLSLPSPDAEEARVRTGLLATGAPRREDRDQTLQPSPLARPKERSALFPQTVPLVCA